MDGHRSQADEVSSLSLRLASESSTGAEIPVQISYEIIRLFSEGLYQSPHKAIEELVSNSYDAGATRVFVISPESRDGAPMPSDSLWVIDDGVGMNEEGFRRLWLVAESTKGEVSEAGGRPQIGQFGIGKLAAYVLAWRLTHISKTKDQYYYTSMDFRRVEGRRQNAPSQEPVTVELREVDENRAKELLAEVEERDSDAWAVLFGEEAATSWTAAALSEFKDLFGKFRPGVLSWVLRTGLPIVSEFAIYLDGQRLESSRLSGKILAQYPIGGSDEQARKLGLTCTASGVVIPGIEGEIRGKATLYEKSLTGGKSSKWSRSNGFFIRVRGRVINLEDELFGIVALNHAAWSRFVCEVEADGLREHLLSSREGVRDSMPVSILRRYLHNKFNECRAIFETEKRRELVGLEIELMLQQAPAKVLADPLVEAVRQALAEKRQPSHYISAPSNLTPDEETTWLEQFEQELPDGPFNSLRFSNLGAYDRLAEYDAETRTLIINEEHPFIAKILAHSKNQTPATLFATSEIITDALIRDAGIDSGISLDLFIIRDRALRQIAGDFGPDPADVLRHLAIADQNKDALERAVGEAFITLGFHYDRRGGNRGGPDGVLDARLGRWESGLEDFRLVYDAKTTTGTSISVSKVHFDALWDFKQTENADFGFIIGKRFDGQDDPSSTVNRRTAQGREDRPLTVMLTDQLKRLVELHYRYGVTMSQIRELFQVALTVQEVHEWLDGLDKELSETQAPVPVKLLLNGLEDAKRDPKSRPNINAVRALDQALREYEPERLARALQAVETIVGSRWIEVDERSFDVRLKQSADQILNEFNRRANALGLPASSEE